MFWICLFLLVVFGMANVRFEHMLRAHFTAQAGAQASPAGQRTVPAYVACPCMSAIWNDAMILSTYDSNHPNLSVRLH